MNPSDALALLQLIVYELAVVFIVWGLSHISRECSEMYIGVPSM